MQPYISFVITCFNRADCVIGAINSAYEFGNATKKSFEVIVVDDCSTDFSNKIILESFQNHLNFSFIQNKVNLGVTGAKNVGISKCRGELLVVLDSDDLLIPESAEDFIAAADLETPLHFFRCVDLSGGELIGENIGKKTLPMTLSRFLNDGTPGECMAIFPAWALASFPYATQLRGCEGLSYAYLMDKYGPAKIHPLIIRKYRTSNDDRLSTKKNAKKRALCLANYYTEIFLNFGPILSVKNKFLYLTKMLLYFFYGQFFRSPSK